MLDRLAPLFGENGRFQGRYRVDPDSIPVELQPGALWEVPVFPMGSQSCDLMRVYALDTTSGPLVQAHWRNETRALLRLSTRGQRALPRFKEAELLNKLDLGYIIVSDSGHELATDRELQDRFRQDRRLAFLRYFAVVEAVAAMHEEGLLHRNLTAQALRVSDEHGNVVVDGFQMSSFVAAWFRATMAVHVGGFGAPDPLARWMLAPERQDEKDARSIESYATDVFSLGMIGIWIFVGLTQPPDAYDGEAHRAWVEEQHAALRKAKLPKTLERALEAMTALSRPNRIPSGVAVREVLAKSYGAILYDLEWRADEPERRYELLYLRDSIKRTYEDGRGRSHPSDPDYLEYNLLIEQDVVGGVLTWSPDGFEPWERVGDRAIARQAKVVLLGRTYAYFCAYLDTGRSTEDRTRIVVKHMLPMGRAGVLRRAPQQRAAPRVVAAHFTPSARRPPRIPATSPWSDIIPTVEHEGGRTFADPVVATGRWLLDAQRADLRRAWYLVTPVARLGDTITLRDVGAPEPDASDLAGAFDQLWRNTIDADPMASVFGRIVERTQETGEVETFLLKRDREDRDHVAELLLVRALDPNTCLFRIKGEVGRIDERVWVLPSDRRTRTQFRRQADALLDVEQRFGHLAAQIRAPRSVRIPLESPPPATAAADANAHLFQQILESWPIFAIQGPPGTGKTWIAAEILQRALADDRWGRFLVSAQSHHALDNLLKGVVERVPQVAALRIASESTVDNVSEQAKGYLLGERVRLLRAEISESTPPAISGALRAVAAAWRKRARGARGSDVEIEADLARRLPRASSIVFTTCGQATHDALGSSRGAGSFDWVLIEEAARGWLTEFFVPMVHGARWLLIGDQAQLPAHRQREFENLLGVDIRDQVTTGATGIAPVDEWRRYLRYFGHIMQASSGKGEEPRARLLVQRRMHPDIATLVSETFYGGELETHPSAMRNHGFDAAPYSNTALLWLDTSGFGPDAFEASDGGLRNHCEMQVLRYFFRNRLGEPRQHEAGIRPLVVLSPYRAQVTLLKEQLGYGDDATKTVDSFQGGEAEIVAVSLVRNNAADAADRALGFLDDPSRVNVMFSRARRLLVVVGALSHFERHGRGLFWERLCGYVRSEQRFVYEANDGQFRYRRGR